MFFHNISNMTVRSQVIGIFAIYIRFITIVAVNSVLNTRSFYYVVELLQLEKSNSSESSKYLKKLFFISLNNHAEVLQ